MNRKIIAATLTLLLALQPVLAAFDLGDYPGFLFEDHNLVAYVVYGEDAAVSDVVGGTDLAVRLAAESYEEVPAGEEEVVVTGDAYRIDKSTDFLEYDEELDGVLDILGEDELNGLAGGTFSNAKGTFTYNEYVTVPETAYVKFAIDPDDDTDTPANYLFVDSDTYAYIYKLEFPTALEATIANINTHLENKKITMLGTEYTITDATRTAANNWKLTLMGGASKVTGNHGEPIDLTVGGTTYTVTPSIYSSSEVVLKLNTKEQQKQPIH